MAALGVARTYCACVCGVYILYCCNTNFIIYNSNA